MKTLILGRGKTGSLVAEVGCQRGHEVSVLGAADNPNASALTPARLVDTDVVIDFTSPHAVLANITACVHARAKMVVGTTGWYSALPRIRKMVEESGIGFLYGANFSVGVNLFFDIARSAAAGLQHGYSGQIFERHHVHKKDAPSGTLRKLAEEMRTAGYDRPINLSANRAGAHPGTHEIGFDSVADTITLRHTTRSREGFARGALRAARWVAGKRGVFEFREILSELEGYRL